MREHTRTVTVVTDEKPSIFASNRNLDFGQVFDPMEGV